MSTLLQMHSPPPPVWKTESRPDHSSRRPPSYPSGLPTMPPPHGKFSLGGRAVPQQLIVPREPGPSGSPLQFPADRRSPHHLNPRTPCTPLLWDTSANHASLPTSPLLTWGDVNSPGLSSTPESPLLWDGDTDPRARLARQLAHPQLLTAQAASFDMETADAARPQLDSLFSKDGIWAPSPVLLQGQPAPPAAPSPLSASPRESYGLAVGDKTGPPPMDGPAPIAHTEGAAEEGDPGAADPPPEGPSRDDAASPPPPSDAGTMDDGAGRIIDGARCAHRKSWKRLRAKKGCAFFVCFQCGAKWRMKANGDADEAAPAHH